MPSSRTSSRSSDVGSARSAGSKASAKSSQNISRIKSIYAPQNPPRRTASRGSSRQSDRRGNGAGATTTTAGYSWAAGAEREILSTVQNLSDREIHELSQELSAVREEKLRSLAKAQEEKQVLADELKVSVTTRGVPFFSFYLSDFFCFSVVQLSFFFFSFLHAIRSPLTERDCRTLFPVVPFCVRFLLFFWLLL